MKKQLSENWQLWILMASIVLALSAGVRKMALDLEWSEFNANIAFIVSFVAMMISYLVFHELSIRLFQPMFDYLFKKLGFKPHSKEINTEEKIVIDYRTTRGDKIRKQEERALALESRVIKYIGDVMSPFMTEQELTKLIDRSYEFIHMRLVPDFQESDAVVVSDELSTMDLMHYGWNIAKPFGKPCSHTALFLKQIFPVAFRNTEVYTIEKKLRLNPMQGRIKIDKGIAGQRTMETTRPNVENIHVNKHQKKSKMKGKTAQDVAIADMLEEGFSGAYELEE